VIVDSARCTSGADTGVVVLDFFHSKSLPDQTVSETARCAIQTTWVRATLFDASSPQGIFPAPFMLFDRSISVHQTACLPDLSQIRSKGPIL
jgi:hypothetical protein